MSDDPSAQLVINGWKIYTHPRFDDAFEAIAAQVEHDRERDPQNYKRRNPAKRLATIIKLVSEVIPTDPTRPEYRPGDTLGARNKHWFRVKFLQQYRLFFRYSSDKKTSIYVWVTDATTKRAYASKVGAYAVFRKMLANDSPPDDWGQLLKEAQKPAGRPR